MKLKFYQSLFLIVALGFAFNQTAAAQAVDERQILNAADAETAPRKRDRKRTRKIPAQRIYLDELDYQNYWEQFEEQRENL